MIEKYFKAGIRFTWTKPQDVPVAVPQVGEFVDSARAATPMIYMGLEPGKDGKLIDPYLRLYDVNTLGLRMRMPIQYAWLDYAHARTSRLPIGPYDVLTGFMSGCIIVHYSERGVRYAGHVGTISDDVNGYNRILKRKFAFAMAKDTKGFNPAAAWDPSDQFRLSGLLVPQAQQTKIVALVTTTGDFYSILMMNSSGNDWVSGGIKKVPPMNHDQLKLLMLRD